MNKTIFFLLIFFSYIYADTLEEKLRYGANYYDIKIAQLQKENNILKNKIERLEKILKLHHRTLEFLLDKKDEQKSIKKHNAVLKKEKIYIVTKKTPLCLDELCTKIKTFLPVSYIFKAKEDKKNLKITYYLYKNKFWHFVKRDRWIKNDNNIKEYNINIKKECNTIKECIKMRNIYNN